MTADDPNRARRLAEAQAMASENPGLAITCGICVFVGMISVEETEKYSALGASYFTEFLMPDGTWWKMQLGKKHNEPV